MRKFFRSVSGLGIFMIAILSESCVGMVHYNEMKLQTKMETPTILRLRNYGNIRVDFFKQSEKLIREHLIKKEGEEYGYYVLKYKSDRYDDYYLYLNIMTYGILSLFGCPTSGADFDLTAYLYIFDSNGLLIKEYKKSDSTRQIAGIYYGHNPTKKLEKKYSEIYEKIFENVAMDAEQINNFLLKSGPLNAEKTKKAKSNIKAFFEKK